MFKNGKKCKLVFGKSVLSTLHRGGAGQNAYRMNFSNPCAQGCSSGAAGLFQFIRVQSGNVLCSNSEKY